MLFCVHARQDKVRGRKEKEYGNENEDEDDLNLEESRYRSGLPLRSRRIPIRNRDFPAVRRRGRLIQVHNTVTDRTDRGFGAVLDTELGEKSFQVGFDGVLADK